MEWSKALRIAISKRSLNDQLVDESNLLPPLNFKANILGQNRVQLEWNKSKNPLNDGIELYYIVNIRQLTINSGTSPLIQEVLIMCTFLIKIFFQLKVEGDNFIMDHLNEGELYEITIRSAKNPDNVSSAAAILELNLASSNLIYLISVKFKNIDQCLKKEKI